MLSLRSAIMAMLFLYIFINVKHKTSTAELGVACLKLVYDIFDFIGMRNHFRTSVQCLINHFTSFAIGLTLI